MADVLHRDLLPVAGGAVVGALLAFPVDKLLPRNDGPVTMLAAVAALALMIVIGMLAVSGPAGRVLSVDATEALPEI